MRPSVKRLQILRGASLKPVQCVLTHAHLDHVLGAGWVYDTWGLKPRLHLDRATYEQAPRSAAVYGVPMDPLPPLGAGWHDEPIRCGEAELEVASRRAMRRVTGFCTRWANG